MMRDGCDDDDSWVFIRASRASPGCAGGSHPSSCVCVNISCRCSGEPDSSFFSTINDKESVRIKKGLIFFCAQSRSVSSCTAAAAVVALVQYLRNLGVEIWWRRRRGGPQKSIPPKKLFLDGVKCSQPFRKNMYSGFQQVRFFFELHFSILASLLAGAVALGFGYQLTGTGWFERHSVDSEWPGWGGVGRFPSSENLQVLEGLQRAVQKMTAGLD